MVLHSTRWLALSYFTYFFSYGIFLPFWSVWLKGIGLTPETIGVLLGAGLVARFLGSLLIAPRVSDPSLLIKAVRILALLTTVFVACFWVSHQFAWLMVVMVGFNLFFSPLVPLTDALANTAKADHHGLRSRAPVGFYRLCDWLGAGGETGQPLRLPRHSCPAEYRYCLDAAGHASATVGDAAGESRHQESAGWPAWQSLVAQSWRFLACVCLLQGHMRRTMVSAPSTGRGQDIPLPPWAICGRWAWWPKSLSLP